MDTVMQHRQVVSLVCGLMSDPTPMIHFVYERWIWDGQKSAGKTLIEAVFHEAGLPVPKDLLHNQWINYYDHDEVLIKDTSPVYVPSRWYQFHNMKAKLSCNIQHGNPPEGTMSIICPDESVTKDLLSICHRICQYQAVTNLDMEYISCEDLQETYLLRISKNAESLQIISCELPLSHLMQQINGCCALRVLDLSGTTLTGCLSSFLPDSHAGLPELRELGLKLTSLNKDDLQHLFNIIELNKLPKLQLLYLSHNTLTGCLSSFLADSHTRLPELNELKLDNTGLNKDDLQHLLSIAHKLPKLSELDLSGYTLTGCLSRFLPDPHPGLPELDRLYLYLRNTSLNKDDLQHFLLITQSNKLPKLTYLDLSENTLTGCLSSLLPDPHPGLPELEWLHLWSTSLNKEDLKHLTHLIQTHKLPRLKFLNLTENRLREMETDVENLIEACVNHHQRELMLRLGCSRLSDAFENKWKHQCAGTQIKLDFSFYRYW